MDNSKTESYEMKKLDEDDETERYLNDGPSAVKQSDHVHDCTDRKLIKIVVSKKKPKSKVKKKERTKPLLHPKATKRNNKHTIFASRSNQRFSGKTENDITEHTANKDFVNKENDEFEIDTTLCFDEMPHEIVLAVRSLKSRHQVAYCPPCHPNFQPMALILKPMLYDVFLDENETNADESFTGIDMELKNSIPKLLQPLKLHGTSSNNDIALMETTDYISGVKDAHGHFLRNNLQTNYNCESYISWFVNALQQNWYEPSISYLQIHQCYTSMNGNKNDSSQPSSSIVKKIVDHLLQIRVLIPHTTTTMTTNYMTDSSNCFYWFSLPKLGIVSKALTKGRTKLITTLNWAPQKQLKRSTLDTIDLMKGDPFVAVGAFVIRDWIARRSTIKRLLTPNGEFIQLITRK